MKFDSMKYDLLLNPQILLAPFCGAMVIVDLAIQA